ncbi:nucleoid-associated protein [Clostridium cochlearium]|uniref:Nucleoid-associated protein n=1 Tax=Clostridium cochlearium TaxID=1494 RepID=A0A7Y3V542_CLOCO|nr:nucleoid-associated protein [Clostridium cochlearium]NOH14893.1 nucleoid-associated protein [Clostridium cochlearium]
MRIDSEKNLIIQKSIMHVLDNKSEEKLLSDMEMNLNTKTEELLIKHITNSVNDEYVRLALFEGDINVVQMHCQTMLTNDNAFIKSSKEIANYLFDAMKDKRISPAYLVLIKFIYNDQIYISLLKLDFNENLISDIKNIDGKQRIDIVVQGMGVPNEKQKLHKCMFFKSYEKGSEYDIILLDKQTRTESDIANFFTHNFLHCTLAITDRDNTRNFCTQANKFIGKKFEGQLERISELKEKIVSTLKADTKINLISFAKTTFGNDEKLQNDFINYMTEKSIDVDFDIDKRWVKQNIKKKKIITDSGIEIKIDEKTAGDKEKFKIEYPYEDKSKADIIIKNVEYSEKFIK